LLSFSFIFTLYDAAPIFQRSILPLPVSRLMSARRARFFQMPRAVFPERTLIGPALRDAAAI
jgi:hypothetical protein